MTKETAVETSLEELILNTTLEKYKVINIAMLWMKELKKKEEYKGLARSLIIDQALKDVLSGKVSPEMIEKLEASSSSEKAAEEKSEKRKK